jgi:hypothetical protein
MTHFAHRPAKGTKIHGIFLRHEKWFRTPGGRGSSPSTGQTFKLVTVLGNFSAKGDLCRRRRNAKQPQDVMAESGERAGLDAASV